MDKKAIAEIRKLMTMNNCRIDKIRGCYVDENREIVTELHETFLALEESTVEKYCEIFRQTLGGKPGKNLFNLEFPLEEEAAGGRQDLLYRLEQSGLEDSTLVRAFWDRVIETVKFPEKYLILLAHGIYDIPGRTSDGFDMEDASDYVYSFILCSICPVILLKEGLCYDSDKKSFLDRRNDWAVQRPDTGFLFPSFNDRGPDIHQTLFFARRPDELHEEIPADLLGCPMPLPEDDQRDVFKNVVEATLGRDCDFENVKNIHEAIGQLVEEEKDSGEPPRIEKVQLRRILYENGADGDSLDTFDAAFDEAVGVGGSLMAENAADTRKLEIKTPSLRITVKSEMADMIKTRFIDGIEYLTIPVADDIEVNGIRILQSRKE
ncbi:MAG: DUF4317 domain-containing protein [Lachnospiraceae bacterium]|nr:DUF4317 domain-containing protein [Lachnospiraceae bacterium]